MIYFWSDLKRKSTFEELRRAVSTQILISSIHQQLNDYQKQVTLLSQIMADSVSGGASPEEVAQFNTRLNAIGDQIVTSLPPSQRAMKERLENKKTTVLEGCSLSSLPRRKNKKRSLKAF